MKKNTKRIKWVYKQSTQRRGSIRVHGYFFDCLEINSMGQDAGPPIRSCLPVYLPFVSTPSSLLNALTNLLANVYFAPCYSAFPFESPVLVNPPPTRDLLRPRITGTCAMSLRRISNREERSKKSKFSSMSSFHLSANSPTE